MNIHPAKKIFFAYEGLSQSEANHQANMVKQIAASVSARLNQIGAVKEVIEFEGKSHRMDSSVSMDKESLIQLAQEEGKMYALSAWLREAVKTKQELIEMARKVANSSYMLPDEKFPALEEQPPIFIEPVKTPAVTEQDIFGEMNIKERADYYTQEALAAHLGKKLHEGGLFDIVRKGLQNFIPIRFHELSNGQGRKAYPVTREKLFTDVTFDEVFFTLQREHRAAEQALNAYKARIQNEVTLRNAQIEKDYSDAYNKARVAYQKELADYNERMQNTQKQQESFIATLEARRLEKVKDISAWKIVVPNDLQATLEFVKNYSK
jgi:hypothetical protein